MEVLKTMYELRRRAVRRGAGVWADWDALLGGPPMQRWRAYGEAVESAGVPWAVIGAVAARLYRPERTTKDFDALVRPEDRTRAEEALSRRRFRRERELVFVNQPHWSGSAWAVPRRKPKLDLISVEAPWVEEGISLAAANRDREGLPVLTLPFLVLTKLESFRSQDVADLAAMLGIALQRGDTRILDRTRQVVRVHFPDREPDLDQLLELGRWEIGPPT